MQIKGRINNMKYLNKTFFKFIFGFLAVLAFSISITVAFVLFSESNKSSETLKSEEIGR